jgi:hypothetical protein
MSKEAFFEQYRPLAANVAKELNVPESAILSHWAVETAYGKSIIPGTNNLGNIKDVSAAGTGVAAVDNETKTTDRYRKYADFNASAADYADLIKRKHPGAMNQTSAQGFAEALKKSGYFESDYGVANITKVAGEKYTPSDPRLAEARNATAALRASIAKPLAASEDTARLDLRMRQAREDKALLEENAPSLLTSAAAAMVGNTDFQIGGAIKEMIWGPKHQPEPGFVPDMALLQKETNNGADRDLIDDYAKAKSKAEAAEILAKWEEENFRLKTVMANGKVAGLALSFAAELPTFSNLIPAVAAAKTMRMFGKGSETLAASGAGFGTVAKSAITENVLGGTAVEALRQGLTGDYSLLDLGLSVTVDTVFGLGVAGLQIRGRAPGLDINEATGQAVRREVEYAAKAEQELGGGATATELRKTMDRMFKEDIDAPNKALGEDIAPERKLDGENAAALEQQAVRVYHGGIDAGQTGPLWFTTSQQNAEGWARKAGGSVFYVDLPPNHPSLKTDKEFGVLPPPNFELSAEWANKRRLLSTELSTEDSSSGNLRAFSESVARAKTRANFGEPGSLQAREDLFRPGAVSEKEISTYTGGKLTTLDELNALPSGVHFMGKQDDTIKPAVDTAMRLAQRFLGNDFRITVASSKIPTTKEDGTTVFANAAIMQVSERAAMIRVSPELPPAQKVRSIVHEIGHAIFNREIGNVDGEQLLALQKAFRNFLTETDGAAQRAKRYSVTNVDQMPDVANPPLLTTQYQRSWDEFSAEQFVKYIEADVRKNNSLGLTRQTVLLLQQAISKALQFLRLAKREAIGVTDEYKAFFDSIVADIIEPARPTLTLKPSGPAQEQLSRATATDVVNEIQTDPDAVKYGLTIAPINTPAERKQAQAMLALHKQAEAWAIKNPKDANWDKRAQNLTDNRVFNVASVGLTMLKSESPLVRMIASQLVEDASGVSGKHVATASINKELINQKLMGNVVLDIEGAYGFWSSQHGGSIRDDLIGGTKRKEFDNLVAAEIEARLRTNEAVTRDANVKAAADSIESAYQRMANAQRSADTLGAGGLPDSSRGYMPHKMSAKAVLNLTNEQSRILHSALTDQFVGLGWDTTMADKVASQYMKRVRDRASGDYGSAIGGRRDSESLVEEALRSMELPDDVIKAHMAKYNKGGASFTKKRIDLDLNRVYDTPTGPFKLLDIFETNHIELLRSQAGRVSGEVALTQWGVRGKPGLKLLRDAMEFGEDGKRASIADKEAFDQMAAEFMNEPFGTQAGKFMQRAMGANSLVRLGGLVYSQISETLNGIASLGVVRAALSVAAVPRLHGEIKALVRGEKVDNPFLTSIELAGGAEFGTKEYKLVLPYDDPSSQYPTYGQDTLTLTDRLIRGGGHLQSKLSGWRYVHSAQQRGMAEQIVQKILKYVKDGKEDVALQQFGITPELRAQISADLNKIATFDGSGNLLSLDVTKMTDPDQRTALIQAVWRGTNQIIQGTYIGERGKWAHDGWLQLLTQFRTFSLVSMEKQWGRQRNSRGVVGAGGIILGSMAMAVPIHMARVYASSIGRPDQDEYIDDRLQPQHVARAVMNYVGTVGLAGDFVDLLTAPLPEDSGIKPTGGRAGVESSFVGNYVLPASSLVDDMWKYIQSPTELDDAVKAAPLSRLPYLVPFFNTLKD